MAFLVSQDCKCCNFATLKFGNHSLTPQDLHHCEACWNEHHNGEKHKDFVPLEMWKMDKSVEKVLERIMKEDEELLKRLARGKA